MNYSTLLIEKKENIGTITLNRPDKLNALCALAFQEFIAALHESTVRTDGSERLLQNRRLQRGDESLLGEEKARVQRKIGKTVYYLSRRMGLQRIPFGRNVPSKPRRSGIGGVKSIRPDHGGHNMEAVSSAGSPTLRAGSLTC